MADAMSPKKAELYLAGGRARSVMELEGAAEAFEELSLRPAPNTMPAALEGLRVGLRLAAKKLRKRAEAIRREVV